MKDYTVKIKPQRPSWVIVAPNRRGRALWLEEAIHYARQWVRAEGWGQVLIYDTDGRVQHKQTYPFTLRDHGAMWWRILGNAYGAITEHLRWP